MRVELPYGRELLSVEVPDSANVLLPHPVDALRDAPAAMLAALRTPTAGPPLRERVRAGQKVAVVVSDITRPVPNELILRPLLAELEAVGRAGRLT